MNIKNAKRLWKRSGRTDKSLRQWIRFMSEVSGYQFSGKAGHISGDVPW